MAVAATEGISAAAIHTTVTPPTSAPLAAAASPAVASPTTTASAAAILAAAAASVHQVPLPAVASCVTINAQSCSVRVGMLHAPPS